MSDIAPRSEGFYTDTLYPHNQPAVVVHADTPEAYASLFMKLVQVNASVTKVQRSGRYNQGNTKYEYASQEDVMEPIAAAFAENNLAFIPSVVNVSWGDMPGKYATNRICTVHVQIVIGDGEKGGYAVAHAMSAGANGDKAINAAYTTAVKYFLAKLAMTSFGDDADSFDGSGAAAGKRVAATKQERDDLTALIKKHDKSDAVKEYLAGNKITWSKITLEEVNKIKDLVTK